MPSELVESQQPREGLSDAERWSRSAVGTGLYQEALSLRSGLFWASAPSPEPVVRPIRLVVKSRGKTLRFVIRSASFCAMPTMRQGYVRVPFVTAM